MEADESGNSHTPGELSLKETNNTDTLAEEEEAPMETTEHGEASAHLPPNEATATGPSSSKATRGSSCESEASVTMGGDVERPEAKEEEGSVCGGGEKEKEEGEVLTEAMLMEEQRLHDTESRESSTEREKVCTRVSYHTAYRTCTSSPNAVFSQFFA